MMKSPTSLIRFRNAVGVMLALSAIFAVVLSTISLPSDDANAQVTDADDAVTARAKAWFNSLTLDEAINAVLGEDADAVADDSADDTTSGRQYVGTEDPTVNDTPIEFIYAAWMAKSDTQSFYDGLPASATDDATTTEVDESDSGIANKAGVNALVDGSTDPGDLYAVGEEPAVVAGGQGIRGFQSVELWWSHLTCAEARQATGEGNSIIVAGAAATDDPTSMYCDITRDDDGTNPVVSLTSYGSLSSDAKAQADEVGQAILGLSSAGSASSADNALAMRWWDALASAQRVVALYGDGVAVPAALTDPGAGNLITLTRAGLAALPYSEITTGKMYTFDRDGDTTNGEEASVGLDDDSKGLVPEVKALINDRATWIYGTKGPYEATPYSEGSDANYEGVAAWWSAIGCTQRQISVGEDNEPANAPTTTPEFCVMEFDELTKTQDRDGSPRVVSQRERVMTVGRALLNLKAIPQVGAWWDTLSPQQMVNVVYGEPLAMEDDPDSTTTPPAQIPVASQMDRDAFKKMYASLSGAVLTADLPTATTALLTRNAVGAFDANDNGDTGDTFDHDDDATTAEVNEADYTGVKAIVHAIATEVFDPPNDAVMVNSGATITADDEFDPPYRSVADWWETLDCRGMRLAVGEDNDYLDAAVEGVDNNGNGDFEDTGDTAPVAAETSRYCGHFPGALMAAADGSNVISAMAQERVVEVGAALLGLSVSSNDVHANRPSFNEPPDPNSVPTISGTAQVGSVLTADTTPISDVDDVGMFNYQWLSDGADIPGATQKTYTLQPSDIGKAISVRVSYVDGERFPEMITSNASSTIAGSPGEVSRIEPGIRGVTVSAGDTVTLSVDIYGLQNVKDNTIGATFSWSQKTGSNTPEELDGSGRKIDFTAPSSPGTYTVTASLDGGQCQPDDEADREADCEASITVQVRRASAPVPVDPEPINPPGDIPGLIPDSDGNQYEVFTPVEGGTFDGGEGYSISVPSGAVPNGEYIGIRMSDDGAASNLGMTHQRYTLAGNMYGVHAVDASGAAISSYVLEDPAEVCVPLPASARANLSTLSLAAINSDGSLTILAAQAKLNSAGNTMICGNLSNLPATVAVGAQGAPDAIPTATPVPEPELPPTGGTSPASGSLVWVLLLGTAAAVSGTFIVIGRRRKMVRTK